MNQITELMQELINDNDEPTKIFQDLGKNLRQKENVSSELLEFYQRREVLRNLTLNNTA